MKVPGEVQQVAHSRRSMERPTAAKVQKAPTRGNHVQKKPVRSSSDRHPIMNLQRSIGCQAVQRLIRSPYIQTKLQVSTPGDPLEEEADHTADTVMRMPDPHATFGATVSNRTQIPRLHRKCMECEEETHQPTESARSHNEDLRQVHNAFGQYREKRQLNWDVDTEQNPKR